MTIFRCNEDSPVLRSTQNHLRPNTQKLFIYQFVNTYCDAICTSSKPINNEEVIISNNFNCSFIYLLACWFNKHEFHIRTRRGRKITQNTYKQIKQTRKTKLNNNNNNDNNKSVEPQ
jgi:hypothetical protein